MGRERGLGEETLLGISAGKAEEDGGDGAEAHDEWVVEMYRQRNR